MKFAIATALLVSSAHALTCTTGTNQATFNQCAYNSLTDPNGMPGPTDQFSACKSLQTDNYAYYNCLCRLSNLLVNCYSMFCTGDTGIYTQQQFSTQFCGAAQHVSSPSNAPTASLSSLPPLPTFSSNSAQSHTAASSVAASAVPTAAAKAAGESNGANMLMNAVMLGVAGAVAAGF
ncbi:hypothetical protein BATDEDRAFT_25760 [Batrachochytrium dendrobatidis JAM81]|uniref:Extracellular membrane protein CFEM domain-containing protein n=2 Tax=Batrachochytrium dendrobatidis TaxID=109871 RepID=F4P5I8_BATDJ|nr:uncharacterized protein BATDEDRAFT_25760 [Batrachochytrium dendrobatidis JAM81]EGF79197.1 hypothetical protein BATDEDRAFT_25760 [Batrachochytrium dendrobatidis JAM81]KAJ8322691.1 hypothetical protein O5D80_008233 [Batrachochytrium dendrobatidis]KAK5666051.1 hypothetical protein QVD99_007664 [Batrachochytrium dendrobatidis]OAJ42931.1 hypothetical protein BDEG_26322 [Batrachochytrium dendrobatidis JEL423]|eukprot:XP_006679873.1 hypothetical protein BATDEDRAFT_25760 [Batrachochytrium dendrobatidis JAM81]